MALTAGGCVRVGFAAVEITPPMGTHLAGSGAGIHRPAQTVLDPLYARAAVFVSSDTTLCLIEVDATVISSEYAEKIASGIMRELALPRENVMVMGTQTHSAPPLGYFNVDDDYELDIPAEREYIRGGERAYSDFAAQKAVEAAVEAKRNVKPLLMQARRGIQHDLAFNRRAVSRVTETAEDTELFYKVGLSLEKGKVIMPFPMDNTALKNPVGPDYISHLEGPTDDEVVAACFIDERMQIESLLLHFTCHPVNAYCNDATYYAVSADWCGTWAKAAGEGLHTKHLPLVINGCCGNSNPINPYQPDQVLKPEKMGGKLADLTQKLVHLMRFDGAGEAKLACRMEYLPLGYREIPQWRREQCAEILGEHPERPKYAPDGSIDVEWFYAASTRSVELQQKREPAFQYPVQVFRIGELAIVALSGEPFAEGQLDIKLRSPAPLTIVGHMANKYVGYIPTAPACAAGGLEAHPMHVYWSKLEPTALQKIADKSVELLNELYCD